MTRYAVVEIQNSKHHRSTSDPIVEANSLEGLIDQLDSKTARNSDPLWPEGDEMDLGGGLL